MKSTVQKLLLSGAAILAFNLVSQIQVNADVNDIPIDAAHFPDASFRDWVDKAVTVRTKGIVNEQGQKDTLLQKIDTNNDHILSKKEREEVEQVSGLYATDNVQGLECFPNITNIMVDSATKGALDFSKNPSLESIELPHNPRSVKFGELPKLKHLVTLNYEGPQLDFSTLPALVEYNGWYSSTTRKQSQSMDFSHNPQLNFLAVSGANIDHINLKSNSALEVLNVGNNNLTDLDLSNNPKLREVLLENNYNLKDLNIPRLEKLKTFSINSDPITGLDLNKFPNLDHLYVARTKLKAIDLSNNKKLTYLELRENQLSSLNLEKLNFLETVIADDNQLKSINLPSTYSLKEVSLNKNSLQSIDLKNVPMLNTLGLNRNLLSTIDLTENTKLANLGLSNNKLNSLDLSKCNLLSNVILDNNHIANHLYFAPGRIPESLSISEQRFDAKIDENNKVDLTQIFGDEFNVKGVEYPGNWAISTKYKYIKFQGEGKQPTSVVLSYEVAPGIKVYLSVNLTKA